MENFKIIIFILVVLISLWAVIDKLKLPYPVLLVLVGLAIGIMPFVPELVLDPEVVFVVFLPPLLYYAASHTSWHDFKTNLRPISALGISLVFFSMTAVAITAHFFIPEFGWPLAFLLGAIVSPPDAVASSGLMKGLGLNKQVTTILEGESLVNDASALIAYRYALSAILTGTFVFWKAGLQFLWVAGGGIIIGLLVGYVLIFIHKRIDNYPIVETCLTLLTPFLSYLLAEDAHTSGILSVVSTGLVISWRAPEIFSYQTRMRTRIVWDTLVFLLNGFIFLLIGLQLPGILKHLSNYTLASLIGYGLLISFITIFIRILWIFASARFTNLFSWKQRKHRTSGSSAKKNDTWKNVLILSWTGSRGVISMATALALPLTMYDGQAFPQRYLVIFLCFVVIFITLVVQGFTLPHLIRKLKVSPVDNEAKEETELQLYVTVSTLHYIRNEYYPKPGKRIAEELIKKYEILAGKYLTEIRTHTRNESEETHEPISTITPMQEAQAEISKFQRQLLLKLHKEGKYSDAAIKLVERDMDINDLKLHQMLPKEQL
ncbi:MAG: Na+/H+ antiporter [Chitinophagaceae bacterium]|nr:Na+/H+ antiporter [Chitinophagaceae bacterium]